MHKIRMCRKPCQRRIRTGVAVKGINRRIAIDFAIAPDLFFAMAVEAAVFSGPWINDRSHDMMNADLVTEAFDQKLRRSGDDNVILLLLLEIPLLNMIEMR